MKFSKKNGLVAGLSAALLLSLMACGGGGGGGGSGDTSAPQADTPITQPDAGLPAKADITEFVGAWTPTDTDCHAGFAYGAYWFKRDTLVVTADRAEITQSAYNDAACSSKAGRVTESYSLSYGGATVVGKSNVLDVSLAFLGSKTDFVGGTGISLNKLPDGSATGLAGKGLWDVDNLKLYLGDAASPKDAQGYPTQLAGTAAYIK